MGEKVSPFNLRAKSEQVTAYYEQLGVTEPMPPDETKIFKIKEIIGVAQQRDAVTKQSEAPDHTAD